MSHLANKKTHVDGSNSNSPVVVPQLTSGVSQNIDSRNKEQIELDSIGLGADAERKTDTPLIENGQDDNIDRSVRTIPTSYKLLAFSMIIFFNTSSSFSESTLSPLKGILRAELGVTSKSCDSVVCDANM
jgi:hypothetical protein